MNYAYLYGYETALEKVGFHNAEILEALKMAKAESRAEVAAANPPSAPKSTGGNAPKASKIPGVDKFKGLPGWGKGLAIGGAGLAAGAGLSHLLSKKDKE